MQARWVAMHAARMKGVQVEVKHLDTVEKELPQSQTRKEIKRERERETRKRSKKDPRGRGKTNIDR